MVSFKISVFIFCGLLSQCLIESDAKPVDCGCVPACPTPAPVTPPISFVQVPQPVPIKVPAPPAPSVTIPNMIIALLPPTPKAPVVQSTPAPAPVTAQPLVVPIPQPYPVTVPDYGCAPVGCGCK